MFSFISENYRSFASLGFNENFDGASNPGTGDTLDYCNDGKRQIGFNYQAWSTLGRRYVFTLVRWMAMKCGRKKKSKALFNGHKITERVSYYIYDGYENTEIFPAELYPGERSVVDPRGGIYEKTNRDGTSAYSDMYAVFYEDLIEGAGKKISDEMERLNSLWESRKRP